MKIVLDSSALLALLRNRPGVTVVEELLNDDENEPFMHIENVLEAYYVIHRAGALQAYLDANPSRKNSTNPDQPDLTGLDFQDPSVFDVLAGEVEANKVLAQVDSLGIEVRDTSQFILKAAGLLKSQYRRISLADCLGVSLAMELDATFVTSDRHELEVLDTAGIAQFNFIR